MMKLYLIILSVFIYFIYGCNESIEKKDSYQTQKLPPKEDLIKENTATIISNNESDSIIDPSIKKIHFKNSNNFSVLDNITYSLYPSSQSDTLICDKWHLTKQDIIRVIKDSEHISNQDWHYLYSHLPCMLSGTIKQNNLMFKFEINSGGWIVIFEPDTNYYLGNFKKENEHFFLDKVWVEE